MRAQQPGGGEETPKVQLQTSKLEETAPTRGLKLQSFSHWTALTQAKSSLQLEFLVDETLSYDGLQIHKNQDGNLAKRFRGSKFGVSL